MSIEINVRASSEAQLTRHANKLMRELLRLASNGYFPSDSLLIKYASITDALMEEHVMGPKYTNKMPYVSSEVAWDFEHKLTGQIKQLMDKYLEPKY